MIRPGIILARSGLHFAIKRLKDAEQDHIKSPTATTEANLVRSACESLFWLFALNEDFKNLIESRTSQKIFDWWLTQGTSGNIMNALRLIRNRVTHSYEYYWTILDTSTLKWGSIASPSQQELNGIGGNYVAQQYSDYQT